jgi:outer membrane protein insertion porin family
MWSLLAFFFLGFFQHEIQAYAEVSHLDQKIEIDEIVFRGVDVFSHQELFQFLQLVPGDVLERLKVIESETNIQNFYALHGYENVKIQTRLTRQEESAHADQASKTILEFNIQEGKPTRVDRIEVFIDSSLPRLQKKIASYGDLRSGEIFQQEKLLEFKRKIRDLLIREGYINSSEESVVLESREHSFDEDTARWVQIQIHVKLGEKIRFGYRGNQLFSRGSLDAFVKELLLGGGGKDFVHSIENKIAEEYRKIGYAWVHVSSYSVMDSEGRKIIFSIKEGPLVYIEKLQFEGNDVYSSKYLEQLFFSRASPLVKNHFYVEKDVEKTAELVIEHLKETGYLNAKVIAIHESSEKKRKGVLVSIYIYEGDQTLVDHWKMKGIRALAEQEVASMLGIQKGAPLNLYLLTEGLDRLKKTYRDLGYLDFQILNEEDAEKNQSLVLYDEDARLARIDLQVEEGLLYRVGHIRIDGLEKTKDFVIRRELAFSEGTVLGDSLLFQSERNLRKLGIFSDVSIRLAEDPEHKDRKTVKISVRETDRGLLTWGPGVRNDLGVRLFGQLSYTNLWGLDQTALVTLNANRRFRLYHFPEFQAQASYIWPYFLGLRTLTFRPTLSAGKTQYINFAAETLTGSLFFEKPLSSRFRSQFSYTLEKIHQFAALDPVNDGELVIGSVSPKMILDFRDEPLNPHSGAYSIVSFDYSVPPLGSSRDVGFYRVQWRNDYHLSLGKHIVWYLSARTGYEKNLNIREGSYIPLIKQFALGGIGSLRGYQEQELNMQTLPITGSLSYVNYRTQLDFPFAGSLKLGLFLDAANLLMDRYSLGSLRYATGFGFHYETPVGPISLDWGFNINRLARAEPYVIHFSIGVL